MTPRDAYQAASPARCSAVLGRFLFTEEIVESDDWPHPCSVYYTRNIRMSCFTLKGAAKAAAAFMRRHHEQGLMNRDLSEWWGLVFLEDGTKALKYRINTNNTIRKLHYLGRLKDKELAVGSCTFSMLE